MPLRAPHSSYKASESWESESVKSKKISYVVTLVFGPLAWAGMLSGYLRNSHCININNYPSVCAAQADAALVLAFIGLVFLPVFGFAKNLKKLKDDPTPWSHVIFFTSAIAALLAFALLVRLHHLG